MQLIFAHSSPLTLTYCNTLSSHFTGGHILSFPTFISLLSFHSHPSSSDVQTISGCCVSPPPPLPNSFLLCTTYMVHYCLLYTISTQPRVLVFHLNHVFPIKTPLFLHTSNRYSPLSFISGYPPHPLKFTNFVSFTHSSLTHFFSATPDFFSLSPLQ